MTGQDLDLIRAIRCDYSWPICIFDFMHMATINDFFVFKVGKPHDLRSLIIDDYFGKSPQSDERILAELDHIHE
jgi:hypothetical protein